MLNLDHQIGALMARGNLDPIVIPVMNPADRPRVQRSTARVILLDEHDRTLLFEDSDPGVVDSRWWVVPGGGIDPDESEEEAAVREVAEETGYVLPATELRGPIARRYVIHGYSDQVIEQDEVYFLARVPAFEVDISAHTEDEQLTLQGHRWWPLGELLQTEAWIWPAELVELARLEHASEQWPMDLGHQEESTVADTR